MIPIAFLTQYDRADDQFRRALQFLQLGDISSASMSLGHSGCPKNDPEMIFLRSHISRQLIAAPMPGLPTLVWQVSPNTFEGDWLRFLLQSSYTREVFDGRHEFGSATMVVVDQRLNKRREAYLDINLSRAGECA